MTWRYTVLIVVLATLFAACSSAGETSEGETQTSATVNATTTSVPSSSTSTTTEPATEVDDSADGFELVTQRGIEYLVDDDGTWTMDVVYPDSGGPWPIVVVYHGMTTANSLSEAIQIAESGAVAFAPTWLHELPPTMTREDYIDGHLFDRAACATWAAQEIASEYGGDASNTTIAGFSAGVHPAAWVGFGVVRDDVCSATAVHEPTGVVLGDSQMVFYEDAWDEFFGASDPVALDTTDRFVNPERWSMPDDVSVYLWTTDYTHGRDIENPPAEGSWLHVRDTTGTLVDDFADLGAFDDEWIGWQDNADLLEARMTESGIDVTAESVGGGHAYSAQVYAGIDELIHREFARSQRSAANGYEWTSTQNLDAVRTAYCTDSDEFNRTLHDDVNLVWVVDERWDEEDDEVISGKAAVLDALSDVLIFQSCGRPTIERADYVALPTIVRAPQSDDVTDIEGIIVFKVSESGEVTWIGVYGSTVTETAGVAQAPDDEFAAEALGLCRSIEGTGYTRDADAYLAFMSDDPAIQAIPNRYHTTGEDGVRTTIRWYPSTDDIGCIDDVATSGSWSVLPMVLTNQNQGIFLEGLVIHRHTNEGISDVYHHWTDAGMSPGFEAGTWGMPPNP